MTTLTRKPRALISVFAFILTGALSLAAQADLKNGESIVNKSCAACHKPGVMGAPKIGAKADWQPRLKQGGDVLIDHAIKGFKSMPARGGNPTLKDQDISDAVAYMLNSAGLALSSASNGAKAVPVTKATKATKAATAQAPASKGSATTADKKAPKPAAATKKTTSVASASAKKPAQNAAKFKFNRLMKSAAERNPPPVEDGIHDPENEGSYQLQSPREGMADFAKSISGNYVNWVKTLNDGTIEPRFDRLDPSKKPFVMDLNIVREVKGSMPDVVYPHKQHTQWLDCSNCHPDIFIPKKGANQISMAAILLGEKCGVCHGKVAFPVTECKLCHSKSKKDVAFKE